MPWKDLAIVFYLLLEMDEHQMQQATMLIKKEQLEWWNTSTEDLYQNAMLNTEKLLPYELTSMDALLYGSAWCGGDRRSSDSRRKHVCVDESNAKFWSGSSVISRTSGDACVVSERELLYFAERRS